MPQSNIGLVDEAESFAVLNPVADDALPYGAPAYAGEPGHVRASGAELVGIVVRDPMGDHTDPDGYQAEGPSHVLTMGVATVRASAPVKDGDPVHCGPDGWFAGPSGPALANAVWAETKPKPGPARIRIRQEGA